MKLRSVLLGSLLLLIGCGGGGLGPKTVSMQPQNWDFSTFTNYFPGNPPPAHPIGLAGGWYFDFPVENNWPACAALSGTGSYAQCFLVGYVTTPYSGPAQHQVSMTFQVVTTGNPTFNYALDPGNPNLPNNPSADAVVTILLQERGDDWASDFKRWWALGHRTFLSPGTFTVTVPLTLSNWDGNITGATYTQAQQQAGFDKALQDLGNVGFTFGGGCCAGHGVDVTGGTARFVLLSYSIS
jgi:hypothetical protein